MSIPTRITNDGYMTRTPGARELKTPSPAVEQQIQPAVKAWLDNVLIPVMVKQYIAAKVVSRRSRNRIESRAARENRNADTKRMGEQGDAVCYVGKATSAGA
jgi:hypothetical protein